MIIIINTDTPSSLVESTLNPFCWISEVLTSFPVVPFDVELLFEIELPATEIYLSITICTVYGSLNYLNIRVVFSDNVHLKMYIN